MTVYIAGPFFNEAQVDIIEHVEAELTSRIIDWYSPRSEGVLQAMSKEEQQKNFKKIFDTNVQRMNECTHMIACVEHKDTGTIFEMGYFHAQHKPIVMFSTDLEKVNVMLGQSAYAICDRVDKLVDALSGLYNVEVGSWT